MNAVPPGLWYPPAPWKLRGYSVQSLRLTESRLASELVPPTARVVQVLPRRTLAAVYCARYGLGSTLSYSELAVAPAFIEWHGRLGFWISHIHVDSPHSIAGGRAIWKLPKQFASFTWRANEVAVTDGPLTLCRIAWQTQAPRFRVPLCAPVLVETRGLFWPKGSCRLARCRAEVTADSATPIARLELTRSDHVLLAEDLTLTIPPPG